SELLVAAKQAQVRAFGRPIGWVLENRENARPRATNEGIVASISTVRETAGFGRISAFDYWTLTKSGDFFTATSLIEDQLDSGRSQPALHFNTCIMRATEALRHCINL